METAASLAKRYARMAEEALERGDFEEFRRCTERSAEWEVIAKAKEGSFPWVGAH